MEQVYALVSNSTQNDTSEEEFVAVMSQIPWSSYESFSWTERSIEGSRGHLEGSIVTIDGSSRPVFFDFVNEGGEWKIDRFNMPPVE